MRNTIILLTALAAACVAVPDESVGACRAEGLDDLVGRQATTELGAEAIRRSGARSLRWIQPGDVVTMDYREDRLNIHLDGRNRVDRLICG